MISRLERQEPPHVVVALNDLATLDILEKTSWPQWIARRTTGRRQHARRNMPARQAQSGRSRVSACTSIVSKTAEVQFLDWRAAHFLGSQRTCVHLFSRRRLPSCARACCSPCVSANSVGGSARTTSLNSPSHQAHGRRTSWIGFLAHRVFAASSLVHPGCPEDARMFGGTKLSRKRMQEVGSDSIFQGRAHQRCQRGSGCGMLRRRIWGSKRRTMHRCLPKSLSSARTSASLQRHPATAMQITSAQC